MKDKAVFALGLAVIIMILCIWLGIIVYFSIDANNCKWQHELVRRDLAEFVVNGRGETEWRWKEERGE